MDKLDRFAELGENSDSLGEDGFDELDVHVESAGDDGFEEDDEYVDCPFGRLTEYD